MPKMPSGADPKEPPDCWVCSKPISDPADVTSLFGYGVFEVHRACYDRAIGWRAPEKTNEA
jgi:hypothetical protein